MQVRSNRFKQLYRDLSAANRQADARILDHRSRFEKKVEGLFYEN